VEVSPQSAAAAADLAQRVAASGGAALIIDYGNDAPAADSLRCGRQSLLVSTPCMLHTPGSPAPQRSA
jgi:NADH dehydrogenase [ubiquinone] 1 alpha subcomplex assembly factor 7